MLIKGRSLTGWWSKTSIVIFLQSRMIVLFLSLFLLTFLSIFSKNFVMIILLIVLFFLLVMLSTIFIWAIASFCFFLGLGLFLGECPYSLATFPFSLSSSFSFSFPFIFSFLHLSIWMKDVTSWLSNLVGCLVCGSKVKVNSITNWGMVRVKPNYWFSNRTIARIFSKVAILVLLRWLSAKTKKLVRSINKASKLNN